MLAATGGVNGAEVLPVALPLAVRGGHGRPGHLSGAHHAGRNKWHGQLARGDRTTLGRMPMPRGRAMSFSKPCPFN